MFAFLRLPFVFCCNSTVVVVVFGLLGLFSFGAGVAVPALGKGVYGDIMQF
jgi:hypothetical protein